MATITTGANSGRSLSLDVWETGAADSTNSRRQYGWKLRGSGGGSQWVQSGNFKALVGGNQVYYSSTRINLYDGTIVAEGTVWLQHDNAGNKYVEMYCEAGIYSVAVNVSASGGFWGSNIPRYANITSHSISHIGINKVGVSYATDVGTDWLQYSLNGGAWTDVGGNPYYVGGLTPGTAYNIRSRVRRTDSGLWTESGYLYFTTVAAASVTGANDFTDEGNGYMTYSNPWGNDVQQLVAGLYWNGSEALRSYADISKTGNNYTFTLSEAERSAIRSRMANANTMNILYYVRTQSENTYYYSSVTKTITIINAKPTVNDFSYQDTNAVTVALTGSDQKIIKGKSNLRVYSISATALKSATKKTVIVDNVGATWSDNYEKTITGYSKNTIGVSITDSRDNTSTTISKLFDNFIDYFSITKGSQSSLRGSSGVGENVTLVANGTWFNDNFGSVVNALTASYRYKKTGSSTWITGTTVLTINKTVNNFTINQNIIGDIASGFDVENSYDLELILTDKLSTATFQYTVLPGSPAIAILGNKIALGGKLDEVDANFVQIRKTANFIGELSSNNGYVSKYRGEFNDFNTCLTEGTYKASRTAGITNAPYTGGIYGKLFVYVNDATMHNNNNNWIWQVFIDTNGREYKRHKANANAWTAWTNSKLEAYPVGSVYMNSAAANNPATLFGGTWVRVVSRFLYAMSGDNMSLSTAIGTDTVSTALTVDQLAAHDHTGTTDLGGWHEHQVALNGDSGFNIFYRLNWGGNQTGYCITGANINGQSTYPAFPSIAKGNGNHQHSFTTSSRGSGAGHNHNIPFAALAVWYRTA